MKAYTFAEAGVPVHGADGFVFRAHTEQALRLIQSGQVELPKARKKIKFLMLANPAVTKDRGEHRHSNSMIPGYMESLPGGNTLRIDTPNRPTRTIETNGCRTFKLKRIAADVRSLYITAITDCLVPARA